MNETKHTYLIKQVWRQKGDVLFAEIPFKEENKATELSQTTAPVLLLETKSGGGSGAVFAIGHVTENVVMEKTVEYPGGEFQYHVPFAYDFILEDKKSGLSREDLQELAGQKFAPQAKGGLYVIEENLYKQVEALLKESAGGATSVSAADAVTVEKAAKAVTGTKSKATKAKADEAKAVSKDSNQLLASLQEASQHLQAHPELRLVVENGNVTFYPALLLESTTDRVALQKTITEYVKASNKSVMELAAQEVAVTSDTAASPRFANVIGLVVRLMKEGKFDSLQVPTQQQAFYQAGKLPNPYQAFELQGAQGHYVLGTDGTLYTVEGKTVQHFLGL